jgi:hypothetical protein
MNKEKLDKIESKIDEALANETPEKSLGWMWKDIEKEDSMNFICQDPDCPHCIEEINQMQDDDDDLFDDEWIIKQKHEEITTTAIGFAKWLAKDWMSIWVNDKWLWEHIDGYKPESYKHHGEYYTEEELFEIYKKEVQ